MEKITQFDELSRRLRKIKPHLQTILNGALISFRATENPLRFANAGNALRELLREMLETLAPDECVKDCYWFIPNPDSKTGVTRKHRILYTIHGYVGDARDENLTCNELRLRTLSSRVMLIRLFQQDTT
ncbi:MAG: hypothetical protein ACREQO_04855, partial [Candidatus Binatia bacterium]